MLKLLGKCLVIFILSINLCSAGDHQKMVISPDGYAYINLRIKTDKNGTIYIKPFKYNPYKKLEEPYEINIAKDKCYFNIDSLDTIGNKMALSAFCQKTSKEDTNNQYFGIMIAARNSGKEIIFLDYTHAFSFSPKGDMVTYFKGPIGPYQGEPLPPREEMGLWIYEFGNKTNKKIETHGKGVSDLYWSEHDGNIYIYGYIDGYMGVYRYNISKSKIETTSYKGIYFSQDGKYYATGSNEGMQSKIYRTCDNIEMTEWNQMIIANSISKYPVMAFRFWSKKLNSAAFCIDSSKSILFDVNKGNITAEFYGEVLGTNADGSLVAVHPVKPDNINAYDPSKVEIVNLKEIASKYQPGP